MLLAVLAAPQVFLAQELGSTVRILSVPGGYFGVDGVYSQFPVSLMWAKGTKHTLSVDTLVQTDNQGSNYLFTGWEYSGGSLPGGNRITVTADPAISEYRAIFTVTYTLKLAFFDCPDPRNCASPGTVYVAGVPVRSDQSLPLAAGSRVELVAQPNDGYFFGGWEPGPNQSIKGFINTITLNGPMVVYPRFQRAHRINLETVPAGLMMLADRGQLTTPANLDWGFDSTHTVGAITPQLDRTGTWWAFSSWSDGGAATHAYRVGASTQAETLTATFVPVAVTQVSTLPPGLGVKVDGRDNWSTYNFQWGIGETHRLEAPAQLTDEKGRIWAFRSWSHGGPASQPYTVPDPAAGTGARLIATYDPVARLIVKSTLASLKIKIDDTECATPCDVQRPVGTAIRVTAPASISFDENVRRDFAGWPGSGTTAVDWSTTLGADTVTITADYRTMNRLAASADPPESVSWRLQPASADGFYDAHTAVAISVTPREGYRFRTWTGDLTGSALAGVVAMTSPRSVRAMLDRIPYIAPVGVSNAAGLTPRAVVAPGSIVSIFGVNLSSSLAIGPESPLTQTLGGVTIRAGDRFLPLFFVSPSQINMQLPPDLGEGSHLLAISALGSPDVKVPITVVRAAPGLFAQWVNDRLYVAATHEDGSPVTVDSPARSGELLTVYGTGFGPTGRPRLEGFAVPAAPQFLMLDAVTVQMGDTAIAATAAFAAPGRVGVDAVQFRVEGAATSGNTLLRISINGVESNSVILPIQ